MGGFQQQLNSFQKSRDYTFFMGFVGLFFVFFTREMKSLFQTDSNSHDFNVIYKQAELSVHEVFPWL